MVPHHAPAAARAAQTSVLRAVAGRLGDAGLLLLCIFLLPAAILAIGAPLALLIRFVVQIVQR